MKLHLFGLLIAVGLFGCSTLNESSSYRPARSVWAAVRGPDLNINGPNAKYFSEFIEYLSKIASRRFDRVRDYPQPMTRMTVSITFDSNRKITIGNVDGLVSDAIRQVAIESILEAYSKMPFTTEAYLDFSRITNIIFIF